MSKHERSKSENKSHLAGAVIRRVSKENGPKHSYDPVNDHDSLTVSKIKERLFDESLEDSYSEALDTINSDFRDNDGEYSKTDQFNDEVANFDRVFDEYNIPTPSNEKSETNESLSPDKNDLIEQWRQEIFEKYADDPEMRESALSAGPSEWLAANGFDALAEQEADTTKKRTKALAKQAKQNRKEQERNKSQKLNYYGLTAEEFTALKALKNQYKHIVNPDSVAVEEKGPEFNEKIEDAIDRLDIAVGESLQYDQAQEAVDKLENAVEESQDEDNSDDDVDQTPTPKSEKDSPVSRLEKVRNLARVSRARKAVREGFKTKLNDVEEKIRTSRLKSTVFFGRLISMFNRDKKKYDDFHIQGVTQYSDEQVSVLFQDKGVKLPIDPESNDDFIREIGHENTAIILTESGKRYGLAKGYIIDKQTGEKHKLPRKTLNLAIGKTATLPGVGKIDKVLSVEAQYNSPIDTLSDRLIKSTDLSPFTYYEDIAEQQ